MPGDWGLASPRIAPCVSSRRKRHPRFEAMPGTAVRKPGHDVGRRRTQRGRAAFGVAVPGTRGDWGLASPRIAPCVSSQRKRRPRFEAMPGTAVREPGHDVGRRQMHPGRAAFGVAVPGIASSAFQGRRDGGDRARTRRCQAPLRARPPPCAHGPPARTGPLRAGRCRLQFFSRYPVLKIHATIAIAIARKPSVIATLRPTLTSPAP
jgi:hypothetical protein